MDKSVLSRRRAYTVTTQGSLSQEEEKDLSEKLKIMAKLGICPNQERTFANCTNLLHRKLYTKHIQKWQTRK